MPSTRKPEKYRGALPGIWSPGSAKQLALKNVATGLLPLLIAAAFVCQFKATSCMLVPLLSCEQTVLGRWLPLARRAFARPMFMGCPDCSVIRVAIDQPPTTASNARFIFPPIHWLRPKGKSTTTAPASRCGASLAPMLCSADRLSSCCGRPAPSAPTQLFRPAEESSVSFDIV